MPFVKKGLAEQKEAKLDKKMKKKEDVAAATTTDPTAAEPMQVDGEVRLPAAEEEEEKDELLDMIEKELADDGGEDDDDAGLKRKREMDELEGEKKKLRELQAEGEVKPADVGDQQ